MATIEHPTMVNDLFERYEKVIIKKDTDGRNIIVRTAGIFIRIFEE